MRLEHDAERQEMEQRFRERLLHVTEEFATELTNNKEELLVRHKKQMGKIINAFIIKQIPSEYLFFYCKDQQYEKLMSEKEEAIQDLERKHKRKLIDADTRLR